MRKILIVLAMVSPVIFSVVVPVGAQTTIQPLGNGAIIPAPGVQPFGNGAIITTPGQMPSTVQPLGKGAVITTPGQRPVICTPLGTTFVCN